MRVAGIMSGTSLDGIDVAVVEISGRGWNKKVRTVAAGAVEFPRAVREALLGVSDCETHTSRITLLNFLLPELYNEAVRKVCKRNGVALDSIELCGCHGQTIMHIGRPALFLGRRIMATLQIGDGSVLAERLGMPVVSDFRPRDMAAGGQGAPLVPYVDYLLFRHKSEPRVALNIGGIANITAIPAGAAPEQVIAFDTGPGNMVMDQLVERHTNGARRFDRNGAMARRGTVHEGIVRELLRDAFFRRKPPKSAGREDYGAAFVDKLIATGEPVENLVATAAVLTARSIALGIRQAGIQPKQVIVSGGGARNGYLMERLAGELPESKVVTSAEFGVDPDAKEAIAFAILAHETWHGQPNNLPSATGARRPVVMGKLSR